MFFQDSNVSIKKSNSASAFLEELGITGFAILGCGVFALVLGIIMIFCIWRRLVCYIGLFEPNTPKIILSSGKQFAKKDTYHVPRVLAHVQYDPTASNKRVITLPRIGSCASQLAIYAAINKNFLQQSSGAQPSNTQGRVKRKTLS